jgi:hypothetical protein
VPLSFRVALVLPAGLLLLTVPLAAQLKLGEFSNSGNGTVSSGYTADFGNQIASDHNWNVGGTANFNGSFYNPNFLNYAISTYLNQSRANSDYQSIADSSGVSFSSNIFGGSKFPGAISYSKGYNTSGNYGIPGVSSYVTHGNNDDFGVSWSLNLPRKPSLSVGYQRGNDDYSVYGANDQGNSTFHSFNLRSSYLFEGFDTTAFYSKGGSSSLIPQIISGTAGSQVQSDSDGYGVGISHKLPLEGDVSANFNRSSWNTSYEGQSSVGTVDIADMFASVRPTEKISVSGSLVYSDNLAGQLIEAVVSQGAAVPTGLGNQTSYSFDSEATASYTPAQYLQTTIFVERRAQLYDSQTYSENSYGGSITFAHKLRGGNFTASVTLSGNTAAQSGEDSLGFATTEHYSDELDGWHIDASFNYAQNMQTLLVTYLNSSYNFSGNVRRRFDKLTFSAGGGGSKTALTDQPGTTSSSQEYNASLGFGSLISANASYSKSSGLALATGAGLITAPVPPSSLPSAAFTLYGGTSYAGALSSSPIRGLTMSAGYSRSNSATANSGISTTNQNQQYNALIQYQVRKMGFTTGYARLEQGFGGSAGAPEILSSYYAGITRWFNFF